jgi:hypothetical protein
MSRYYGGNFRGGRSLWGWIGIAFLVVSVLRLLLGSGILR